MRYWGILLVAITVLLCLGFALYATDPVQSRIAETRYEPSLPMVFEHRDHGSEQCVTCHHNYVDNTGHDLCVTCHLMREELTHQLEAQFHDLCMGCHLERQLATNEVHGPVRNCTACHRKNPD